jgi:hypothetical protein
MGFGVTAMMNGQCIVSFKRVVFGAYAAMADLAAKPMSPRRVGMLSDSFGSSIAASIRTPGRRHWNHGEYLPLGIKIQIDHHSLGTKIHSSTYNNRPAPAQINNAAKSSRHTQAAIPVDRAIPPHTPPIHRSLPLRRKAFTADANGAFESVCSGFKRSSFARLYSSSVKPPFARNSASLLSSSASDMGTP